MRRRDKIVATADRDVNSSAKSAPLSSTPRSDDNFYDWFPNRDQALSLAGYGGLGWPGHTMPATWFSSDSKILALATEAAKPPSWSNAPSVLIPDAKIKAAASLSANAVDLSQPAIAQQNLTDPTKGINVLGAWKDYTGVGIKVAVVDDGFDYNHAELTRSYSIAWDYDARNGDDDAYASTSGDRHGTVVAGVIGAARDGTGMAGVAYDAALVGFRIGYGQNGSPTQYADALNKLRGYTTSDGTVMPSMDVANNSWGYSALFSDNFKSSSLFGVRDALLNNARLGRDLTTNAIADGLGIVMVFAAGNERAEGSNVNYHNFQNSPYVITVAATDANGKIASFSTPGAAVLVSAQGANIYTTDRTGADGYVSGDYISASGTSFSAPTVSGVVALMLDANPNLGYRDAQEILAYSATKTDPTSASWKTNGAGNWNGGGLHFSHNFGFGLVDATAAVRLAETWQLQSTYHNQDTLTATKAPSLKISDLRSITSTIEFGTAAVAEELLTIDKVLVDLNISHSRVSDLTVKLTSPAGTEAVLIARPGSGTGSGIVFETSANNFWGEEADGKWTLTVTDSRAESTGTLKDWKLTVIGDEGANDLYVYTNEYTALDKSGAQKMLSDTSGTDTVNLAAVTGDVRLNLASESAQTTGSIAGKAFVIAAGTSIENAYLGDGNDTATGNASANVLSGGRGTDTLTGGLGADNLYGGPGNDVFVYNLVKDSPGPAPGAVTSDTVWGFSLGNKIDLHLLDWDQARDGLQTFAWDDGNGTYSAGEVWFDGTYLNGETDGTTGAEFRIELANRYALTASDIVFV